MATILVVPYPTLGHVNCSLKLVKSLRAGGHRVVYCSVLDVEQKLRAEGFEFEAILESVFPRGTMRLPEKSLSGLDRMRLAHAHNRRLSRMLEAMADGECDGVITRVRPDLIIHDEFLWAVPIIAYGLGVPTLKLHTTVPLRLVFEGKEARPPPRWLTSIRVALGMDLPEEAYFQRVARKHRYPKAWRQPPILPDGSPVPDLLLFPDAFAGAGSTSPGERYHLGPSIDLEREEPEFPWERLQAGRPLIFFSLGTVALHSKHLPGLMRAVTEAASRRPDWQFVIAAGMTRELAALQERLSNVVVVRHAPQLQLLRRASVMITHGGLNSVKECIYFGVPMLVLPLMHDQPINASLVARHGMGVHMAPSAVTADGMVERLEELLGDPSYGRAVAQMSARFREVESPEWTLEVVERFLQRTRALTKPRLDEVRAGYEQGAEAWMHDWAGDEPLSAGSPGA